MKKIVIIGAGGFGREVLHLIEYLNDNTEDRYDPLGFIVDPQYGTPGTIINDKPILGGFDWLEKNGSDVHVVVAVGQPHLRYRLVQRLSNMGCKFINLIHPYTLSHINKWAALGEGLILNGPQSSVQITIGNHVYVNAFSMIGHDVVIGDYCTVAPGVFIDGSVQIGTGCFIGTGANLLPNVKIGEWSVIGAGSVISKDIPPNSVALSATPRVMSQQEPGWHLTAE